MLVGGSVRDRRRAETIQEIKNAALEQLARSGAGELSLRGVARVVGMTVQSLYHYFDSRDALLTALVTDAHHALADAVQAAADTSRGEPPEERRLAAASAFREWALQNRAAFLLIYGTPLPGFEPLPEWGVGVAALRLAAPFADVVFDGWSPAELAAVPLLPGAESIASVDVPGLALPPGALALFIELRARLHGLVMLEIIGDLHPLNGHGEAMLASTVRRQSEELASLRRQAG